MSDKIPPQRPTNGFLKLLVAMTGRGPQKPKDPPSKKDDPNFDPEFDRITRISRQLKHFITRTHLAQVTGDGQATRESEMKANALLKELLAVTRSQPSPKTLGALDETADILVRFGNTTGAIRSLSLYVQVATESGHFALAADGLMKLGAIYAGTGNPDMAREKMGIAGQYYRMVGSAMTAIAFRLAGDIKQELEALSFAVQRAQADGTRSGIVKTQEAIVSTLVESEAEYRDKLGDEVYVARVQKELVGLMRVYHAALMEGLEYAILSISHSMRGMVSDEWQQNITNWSERLSALIQNSSVLWGKTQPAAGDQLDRLQYELRQEVTRVAEGDNRMEFFEFVRILSDIRGVTPDVIVSMIGSEADTPEFRRLLSDNGLTEEDIGIIIEDARNRTPSRLIRRSIQALREVENRGL